MQEMLTKLMFCLKSENVVEYVSQRNIFYQRIFMKLQLSTVKFYEILQYKRGMQRA